MPLLSLWASRSCCQPVTDEDISHIHIKGRFYGPFWMNFRKTSEGDGGVIFDPKNFVADFLGNFEGEKR